MNLYSYMLHACMEPHEKPLVQKLIGCRDQVHDSIFRKCNINSILQNTKGLVKFHWHIPECELH